MSQTRRGTIRITAPKATVGAVVMVLNYRQRPAQWERGRVSQVTFTPPYLLQLVDGRSITRGDSWHYAVDIDRPVREDAWGRRRGAGYVLHVGDDAIRRIA